MLPTNASWTQDQLFFFNQIQNTTDDIWLAGLPGTGKTTAFVEAKDRLVAAGHRVALLAPTGVAAQQIGGSTIARFLHSKTANHLIAIGRLLEEDVNLIYKVRAQLQAVDVVMIDEISMVGLEMFMAADRLFKVAMGSEEKPHRRPFGGKRLLVCGDFLQLAPVEDYHCFYHPEFPEPIELRQVVRQSSITDMAILADLRKGHETGQVRNWLHQAATQTLPPHITPTFLFPHNTKVDDTNRAGLTALPGKLTSFKSGFTGFKTFPTRDVLIPEVFEVKIGAAVMFCTNSSDGSYQNGTQGTVVQIDEGNRVVHVQLLNGTTIPIADVVWDIRGGTGQVVGQVSGLPLKLAWAIRFHKSQGQTLDYVRTDLSRSWAPGLAYVALTRTRVLSNIKLDGIPTNLAPDPKVIEYYNRKGL